MNPIWARTSLLESWRAADASRSQSWRDVAHFWPALNDVIDTWDGPTPLYEGLINLLVDS